MEEERIILGALSTLSSPQLSDLTYCILSTTHRQCYRLSSIVSSPSLFSLTLHKLHSLTLPDKTLLIAHHLLVSLNHVIRYLYPSLQTSRSMNQRDLDAALLLLLLCEVQQHNPEALRVPVKQWQGVLSKVLWNKMLSISTSGIGVGVITFVETVTRSLRFVGEMGGGCIGEKDGTHEVAASRAAVIALPSVEVEVREGEVVVECVICREEMRQGRDVCELPCGHLFHWICILGWLTKRSSCPCCRFQLPTDDVFREIQRLWSCLLLLHNQSSSSSS